MNPIRFVVIGLGGYGLAHIEAVRWLARQGEGRLAGAVALEIDRKARPKLAADLEHEGVQLYGSVDEFFDRGVRTADVLTVPIGIHQHVPLSVRALEMGLHVYCEKPVAATVQDVDELIAAQVRADRQVAVGFQHLYSASIQKLKGILTGGRLGPVRDIALECGWPRSVQYFQRNEWAGRLRIGADWILDSPANNAHSHYLMNMLYLASPEPYAAASPLTLRAELWRAYHIESADTVQCVMETKEGARLRLLVTHTNGAPNGPVMHITCERGRVYWLTDEGLTTVRGADGSQETFDNMAHALWRYDGFKNLTDAIRHKARLICPPAVARAQTLAVDLMHESCPDIRSVPEKFIVEQEDWEMFPPNTRGLFRRIAGMDAAMNVAFHEAVFLSELGLGWTAGMTSREVSGEGYARFPSA